jgi:ribose 5-phosphate isomerase B
VRIAVGADHRGFALKEQLKGWLERRGHVVLDKGCYSAEHADYPDYANAVASAVQAGRARHGLLICSTGIGMSIAANRCGRVRAALCDSAFLARRSREHNNANILCLGGDVVSAPLARRILAAWLDTKFAGGRHARRLAKIRGC